jgi:hypothetical protein
MKAVDRGPLAPVGPPELYPGEHAAETWRLGFETDTRHATGPRDPM